MNHKFLITLSFLLFTITACAQEPQLAAHQKMLENATAYGDMSTAAVALHRLLAEDPDQVNGSWKDSLAYVYLNMNAYGAAEKLSSEILVDKPDDLAILEVRALCRKSTGKVRAAAEDYQALLQQTSSPFHAYYLAQLQTEADSLSQALNTLQIAERLPTQETDWVQLYVAQNQYQAVPLRAAVFHLKGLVLQNLNATENKEYALEAYDKAIELFPDFYLAKNNRKVLEGQ